MSATTGNQLPSEEKVHVMPVGDFREHEESEHCWCKPQPDAEESSVLIHNALDGRESYEQGRKMQ